MDENTPASFNEVLSIYKKYTIKGVRILDCSMRVLHLKAKQYNFCFEEREKLPVNYFLEINGPQYTSWSTKFYS